MKTAKELICELGLDAIDVALITALTGGKSITEAAAEIGISATTAYRRHASQAFRVALADAMAGRWKPHAARLHGEVSKSLDRLIALRDDERVHPSTRLKAIESIFNLLFKLTEIVEIEPRLTALELQAAEQRSGRQPVELTS